MTAGREKFKRSPRVLLADHKRVGKRFLPPFVHLLGKFVETKWVDRPLPELLWIAILIKRLGLRKANQVAVEPRWTPENRPVMDT